MAMRAGLAIRQAREMEAAAAKVCSCGHTLGEHRELPYELITVEGLTVERKPNPEYKSGHFHCRHDDCDCIIIRA